MQHDSIALMGGWDTGNTVHAMAGPQHFILDGPSALQIWHPPWQSVACRNAFHWRRFILVLLGGGFRDFVFRNSLAEVALIAHPHAVLEEKTGGWTEVSTQIADQISTAHQHLLRIWERRRSRRLVPP